MTRRDKASPLAVEGMVDCKFGVAAVAIFGKVWGIEDIPQEEGISPFLRPQLRPVHCGRLYHHPGPVLCRLL